MTTAAETLPPPWQRPGHQSTAPQLMAHGRSPQMRVQSFASRSPLAQTQAEIDSTYGMEWDRRLLWTLGVANKRLYELRLQAPEATFENNEAWGAAVHCHGPARLASAFPQRRCDVVTRQRLLSA